LEKIVQENLASLMRYHKHRSPTDAAKEVGVSQQQIDRILKGQKVRVDTLEKLARGYGLEPYQMMVPGLDVGNPQVLRSLGPQEEAIYAAMKAAVEALGKKGTN